MLKIYI